MMIYELKERQVLCEGTYFIAENATVIGSVILKNNVSVWYQAVIRGDNDLITIGENTNIQDGSVVHTDAGIPMEVGKNVTVGHMAMLHGCTIKENCLIGINSVILNKAVIGKNCILGANTLISEGKEIPEGSLVIGSPGQVKRLLTSEEISRNQHSAAHYVRQFKKYQKELKKTRLPKKT